MTVDVLSDRALNRATLERQLLLRRHTRPLLEAVEHLVGLQAQVPQNPYLALWSRLDAFDPSELEQLLVDRALVRILVLRGTIHLVTAGDAGRIRPLMQPVLDREMERHSQHKAALLDVDLAPVLAVARPFLETTPRTGAQLRAHLGDAFPDLDAAAIAFACRNLIPLVQVPPRGLWHRSGQVASTPLDHWLGRTPAPSITIDELVLRYLAAFGPASVADVAAWTRLTGLSEVVARLGPQLRSFRTAAGRTLVDLPDAPRPDPETPAPVRFLPEYDNALLSHADRSRFGSDARRKSLGGPEGERILGTVLHDGEVVATWTHAKGELLVRHLPLPRGAAEDIEVEGHAVQRFLATADPSLRDVVRLLVL